MKASGGLLALSMFAACATEGGDDQAAIEEAPLINGSPTTARPEVMQISVGPFSCSATMISPSTFLRAAHCISFVPVFFGGTARFVNGTAQSITRIFA